MSELTVPIRGAEMAVTRLEGPPGAARLRKVGMLLMGLLLLVLFRYGDGGSGLEVAACANFVRSHRSPCSTSDPNRASPEPTEMPCASLRKRLSDSLSRSAEIRALRCVT